MSSIEIYEKIMNDRKISLKAKALWIYMDMHDITEGVSYVRLSRRLKEGETALRNTVDELIRHDYLIKKKHPGTINTYQLLLPNKK